MTALQEALPRTLVSDYLTHGQAQPQLAVGLSTQESGNV